MWETTMETAGSQEDSTADELLITDLEEQLTDLQYIYDQTEDFETVVINDISYTNEELSELIESTEEELEQATINDLELDLNIQLEFSEEQGNQNDFENSMELTETLISNMDEDDVVTIGETDYTKSQLIAEVEMAKVQASDSILQVQIDDMKELAVGNSEDSMEDYIKEVADITNFITEGETIVINNETYDLESLQSIIEQCEDTLLDLDEGNTLDDEIAHVEMQFDKEDLVIDDYEDENEEIQEVLEITQDPIEIQGFLYTASYLQEIIEENQGKIQDLEVEEAAENLMEMYLENDEALRLTYEDFYQGMEAVQALVDIMDSTDLVSLNEDVYDKAELQVLIDSAIEYSESQSLQAAIVAAEENVVTTEASSETIADEIQLLSEVLLYMDEGEVVVIDGTEYTIETLTDLMDELQDWLNDVEDEENKVNELEDIQELLDIYEYTVDSEEIGRLTEELEDLEKELEDEEFVSVGDVEFSENDIKEIIESSEELLTWLGEDEEYTFSEEDGLVLLTA